MSEKQWLKYYCSNYKFIAEEVRQQHQESFQKYLTKVTCDVENIDDILPTQRETNITENSNSAYIANTAEAAANDNENEITDIANTNISDDENEILNIATVTQNTSSSSSTLDNITQNTTNNIDYRISNNNNQ